jgi:hypothetical protein
MSARSNVTVAVKKEDPRSVTFEDEYRRFLALYEIEYDERYVWE